MAKLLGFILVIIPVLLLLSLAFLYFRKKYMEDNIDIEKIKSKSAKNIRKIN